MAVAESPTGGSYDGVHVKMKSHLEYLFDCIESFDEQHQNGLHRYELDQDNKEH